jgi:hypothetical protein
MVVLLAFLALALGACGDDGKAEPQRLSAPERARVERAEEALGSYCRQFGLYLARRRGSPPRKAFQRASSGIDGLIALARRKPAAHYQGRTLRELLGDLAEGLEANNCSPELGLRLGRAFAALS